MFQIKAGAVILRNGMQREAQRRPEHPWISSCRYLHMQVLPRLVNMEGYMPGREVVILGSGDIGLISGKTYDL